MTCAIKSEGIKEFCVCGGDLETSHYGNVSCTVSGKRLAQRAKGYKVFPDPVSCDRTIEQAEKDAVLARNNEWVLRRQGR